MNRREHALRGVKVNHDTGEWDGRCGKHAVFIGWSREEVEDQWRKHLYAVTGWAPKPSGDRSIKRWHP